MNDDCSQELDRLRQENAALKAVLYLIRDALNAKTPEEKNKAIIQMHEILDLAQK